MISTYDGTTNSCTTDHGSSVAQDGLLLILELCSPPVWQLVTHGWDQHLWGSTSKRHISSHFDVEGHSVFMHVSKENVASTALYVYSWQKMEMLLLCFSTCVKHLTVCLINPSRETSLIDATDLGALRHVPIALRETKEITEIYHCYTEATSLISM